MGVTQRQLKRQEVVSLGLNRGVSSFIQVKNGKKKLELFYKGTFIIISAALVEFRCFDDVLLDVYVWLLLLGILIEY